MTIISVRQWQLIYGVVLYWAAADEIQFATTETVLATTVGLHSLTTDDALEAAKYVDTIGNTRPNQFGISTGMCFWYKLSLY